jgi:hypothetical protein
MSDPSSEAHRPSAPGSHKIQIGRVQIAANVIVQAIAMLVLVFFANYLSFRHHRPLDWSGSGRYTLSPQTLTVLKQLQEPCKVVVYFFHNDGNNVVYQDTLSLLHEYEVQANRKITVEIVAPAVDPIRAKELQAKYHFDVQEDLVIFDYKGKPKWVESRDFAEYVPLPEEKRDPNLGEVARLKSYKGEQYLTAALMELIEEKPNIVYLVSGHGELALNDPEFAPASEYLELQNCKLVPLLLSAEDRVPEDAGVLFIAEPKQDFTERDIKLLDEYWGRNGRIFAAVGPEAKAARLTQFLAKKGLILRNDFVTYVTPKPLEGASRNFELHAAEGYFNLETPIGKGMKGRSVLFIGDTQSLLPDMAMLRSKEITFMPLVGALGPWYGETDPITDSTVPFPDEKKDHMAPLILAAGVEKGGVNDPSVKLKTPRLVLIGNGGFISKPGLEASPAGRNLLLNSVNWLLNRENLIAMPAKEKNMNDVDLSDEQMSRLGWFLLLGVPAVFGILGLYYLRWRAGGNPIVLSVIILGVFALLWLLVFLLQRTR